MSVTASRMVNEDYEPDDMEESVLEVMKDGRDRGEPWGYTMPSVAGKSLNARRQYTSRALDNLTRAGWVERLGRGFYRYVEDPREP